MESNPIWDRGLVKIYRWFVERTGKSKVFISTLEEKYPGESHLEERILECKELFWTCCVTNSQVEVRPKLNVRLCAQYQKTSGKCAAVDCGKLHLCPVNLLSPKLCANPCKMRLSHNATIEYNKKIIFDAAPIKLKGQLSKQIPMLIRSSLPKLCEDLLKHDRCGQTFCGNLHMCLDHLKGQCVGQCNLSRRTGIQKQILHDFGRTHNTKVLENFGFTHRINSSNKENLLHNLLLPEWITPSNLDDSISAPKVENVIYSAPTNEDGILRISNVDNGVLPTPTPILRGNPITFYNNNSSLTLQPVNLIATKSKNLLTDPYTTARKQRLSSAASMSNVPDLKISSENVPDQQINDTATCQSIDDKKLVYRIYLDMSEQNKISVDLGNNIDQNILSYLTEELNDYFRLVQKGNNSRVYACLKDIQLCTNHWQRNRGCKSCPKLHLCPKVIFNEQGCFTSRCQMNHDTNSANVINVLKKAGLGGLTEDQLKFFLKYRFPGICGLYNGGRRNCKLPTCSDLHVCLKFMHGNCKAANCNKSHEDSLVSDQAKRLMKEYRINNEKDFRESMFMAVRFRKKVIQSAGSSHAAQNEVPIVEYISRLIWTPPQEIDVCEFILKSPHNGSIDLNGHTEFLKKFFKSQKSICLEWLKDNTEIFRFDRSETKIFLCVKDIKPCLDYWLFSSQHHHHQCQGKCDQFHVCKQFLFDVTHSAISCKQEHDFTSSQHNRDLVEKFSLKPLSTQQMKHLLVNTMPSVCKNYMQGKCSKTECEDVHICGDFVNNECVKSQGLCRFQHNQALSDYYANHVTNSYHISDASTLKRSLVYFKMKTEETKAQLQPQPLSDFDYLKGEAICLRYLNELCHEEGQCSLQHPKSRVPYKWQYKKNNEAWKTFKNDTNNIIEKFFCDPTKDKLNLSDVDRSLSQPSSVQFVKDGNFKGIYMGQAVDVRRLSTKSKVNLTTDENQFDYFTEWKWYWQDGSNTWNEYSGEVKSDAIEKHFHAGKSFLFKFGKYNYKLSFDVMQQQNLGPEYFTTRDVIRRPVFQSQEPSDAHPKTQDDQLPWHWPEKVSLEGGRIGVEPVTKERIKSQFKASALHRVKVIDIEEICNAEFHQQYESKKKILKKKLGEQNLNELTLYHVADAAMVDGICAQNFDWRLLETNLDTYGRGNYFYNDPTKCLANSQTDSRRIRFIFAAKVLAGKYTTGDISMKRPPPVSPSDPHVLYDSCVNNIHSPSMYIVFERDQCYPQYLITFLLKKEIYKVDLSSREEKSLQDLAILRIKGKPKLRPRQATEDNELSFNIPIKEDNDRKTKKTAPALSNVVPHITSRVLKHKARVSSTAPTSSTPTYITASSTSSRFGSSTPTLGSATNTQHLKQSSYLDSISSTNTQHKQSSYLGSISSTNTQHLKQSSYLDSISSTNTQHKQSSYLGSNSSTNTQHLKQSSYLDSISSTNTQHKQSSYLDSISSTNTQHLKQSSYLDSISSTNTQHLKQSSYLGSISSTNTQHLKQSSYLGSISSTSYQPQSNPQALPYSSVSPSSNINRYRSITTMDGLKPTNDSYSSTDKSFVSSPTASQQQGSSFYDPYSSTYQQKTPSSSSGFHHTSASNHSYSSSFKVSSQSATNPSSSRGHTSPTASSSATYRYPPSYLTATESSTKKKSTCVIS